MRQSLLKREGIWEGLFSEVDPAICVINVCALQVSMAAEHHHSLHYAWITDCGYFLVLEVAWCGRVLSVTLCAPMLFNSLLATF